MKIRELLKPWAIRKTKNKEISTCAGMEEFEDFCNYWETNIQAFQEIQSTHESQLNFDIKRGSGSLNLGPIIWVI